MHKTMPTDAANAIDSLQQYGLTKREYFAAMALQGIMSRNDLSELDISDKVRLATDYADSLIEALNK